MTLPTRTPKFENVWSIYGRVKAGIAGRGDVPEFGFGIQALDWLTNGMQRGKLTIIAARTSEGKTALALQTAKQQALSGKTVAYLSLEDDREELVERLLCNHFQVNNQYLRRGLVENLPPDELVERVFPSLKLLVLRTR